MENKKASLEVEQADNALDDEVLNSVNGGVKAMGGTSRQPYCKTCGTPVTTDYKGDGASCPDCGKRP